MMEAYPLASTRILGRDSVLLRPERQIYHVIAYQEVYSTGTDHDGIRSLSSVRAQQATDTGGLRAIPGLGLRTIHHVSDVRTSEVPFRNSNCQCYFGHSSSFSSLRESLVSTTPIRPRSGDNFSGINQLVRYYLRVSFPSFSDSRGFYMVCSSDWTSSDNLKY